MSSAAPTAQQQEITPQGDSAAAQPSAKPKPRKLAAARKGVRWVLAVDAWKRQFGHLKHRASFPLLRQVMRSEREQSSSLIQLEHIPTSVLERSLLAHYFILLFAVPATVWAAYMSVKGLAAGIRFDVWFNGWLIQGIPVFIFCGMKVLTSNKSRKLIQHELANRPPETVKE